MSNATSSNFRSMAWRLATVPLLLFFLALCATITSASSPRSPGLILRVRLQDGSMERLQIPSGSEESISLKDVLAQWLEGSSEKKATKIQVGNSVIDDASQTISDLGLKNGSLISLLSGGSSKKKAAGLQKQKSHFASGAAPASDRWDPFPDLAKDYRSAVQKSKTKRSTQSGMSFGDLANIQSALHVVDPQPEGPLKRVYMCAKSAERFQANCYKKAAKEYENRVGLLLGTVQRERVDLKPPKARTSLSSQTEGSQYCDVIKVHAVWEPSTQKPTKSNQQSIYDASPMRDFQKDPELQRVFALATRLGIRPVGWIFTYNDGRHKEEDSLPVFANDAHAGSLLQISNMKASGRLDGSRFATLSMDATTGATEAFQLSDVCVQMVAEDLWDIPPGKLDRFVTTKHAVIVDGKEVKKLDSVLCLVNTAMLSHDGNYAGKTAANSVKRTLSGGLTNKVKNALLKSLNDKDESGLLELLCDFNLLLALDKILSSDEMEQISTLVRKYGRGQKRGSELDASLKKRLQTMLDH